MTAESDQLLFLIRRFVADRVEPQYQQAVTEGIAYTLAVMMAEPRFYTQLSVVARLTQENELLRMHLANATTALQRYQPVKRAPPRKRAAKKAVAKKAPAVKVKGSTAANRRAFKQGYRGR